MGATKIEMSSSVAGRTCRRFIVRCRWIVDDQPPLFGPSSEPIYRLPSPVDTGVSTADIGSAGDDFGWRPWATLSEGRP